MNLRVAIVLAITLSTAACNGALNAGGNARGSGAIPDVTRMSRGGPSLATVAVTVDARSASLATANKDIFGTNFATQMNMGNSDPRYTTMMAAFGQAHFGLVRVPLALLSDYYDWRYNLFASCVVRKWHLVSNTKFDDLMQQVAQPLGVDVNVTIDYGSNANCTGGGDPTVAASWVDHANNKMHYGIKYWSIGNEMYYGYPSVPPKCCGTPDFNVTRNNVNAGAAVYSNLIATKFYPLMKAKDPTIKIGVDLLAGNKIVGPRSQVWDSTVLAKAKYDFVEVHWYPDAMKDGILLTSGVKYIVSSLAQLRSELAAAGRPHTPIYLGEWGLTGTAQWSSIVGALYTALALGELEKGGVGMGGTWQAWMSASCFMNQPGFYTKQTWSTDSLFEAIEGGTNPGCPSVVQPPLGTAFPRANAIAVVQEAFKDRDTVFAPTVKASIQTVKVYGARRASGYGLLFVNINRYASASVAITLVNHARTFTASSLAYDKWLYDKSENNVWAGPVSKSLGKVTRKFNITIPEWSVTALTLVN